MNQAAGGCDCKDHQRELRFSLPERHDTYRVILFPICHGQLTMRQRVCRIIVWLKVTAVQRLRAEMGLTQQETTKGHLGRYVVELGLAPCDNLYYWCL